MTRSARRFRLGAAAVASLLGTGILIFVTQQPASAASAVAVNGATSYQTVHGFGMSEAFGQANAIRNVGNATVQRQMLDLLFSPTSGAGFSILRNLIPSDAAHTMMPTAPASPSATPTYVWDGTNDATDWGQLWLAKQAKTYGVTTIYNDAWSAPGFMKTNNSETSGGMLCGTPGATCASGDWRQAYANYLTQHTKNWTSVGLPPSYLGFVNEPSYAPSYSSMLVNPAQATDLVKVLGPTLTAAGLSTKVACCDTMGWNLLPNYVSAIGADATASANLGIYSSHGYSNAPTSAISTGGKPVWQTEWSIGQSTWNNAWDDNSESSGFTWAQRLHDGMVGANLNAFLYWWGVSNTTSSNGSLIQLSGTTLNIAKRYYSFVNYSRFIRPGAVRIGVTAGDSNLRASAYRNPDGSIALVVLNAATTAAQTTSTLSNVGLSGGTVTPYLTNASNSTAAQPTISLTGGSFTTTVPARSLVTYQITGGSATSPLPSATSPLPSASSGAGQSSPPASTGACTATYQVTGSWEGGFQADVTVTNSRSTPLNGWTVTWTLPSGQAISQVWNGTLTATASTVTVKNASWNGTVAPGASTSFGLIGTGSAAAAPAPTCMSP